MLIVLKELWTILNCEVGCFPARSLGTPFGNFCLYRFALYYLLGFVACFFFICPILIWSKRLGTVKSKHVWIDRCRARALFLKSKKWTERLQLPRDSVFVVRNARVISNKPSVAPRDSVFVVLLKSEHWTE